MIEFELEFREYLTAREARQLRDEELAIEQSRRDLFRKYNEIIADHMSRNILLDELKRHIEYWGEDLSALFHSLDSKTLQLIVSVYHMAWKEKKRIEKETLERREKIKQEIEKATREAGFLNKEDTQ